MWTIDEEDEELKEDERSQTWCDLLNAIERRPDCEIVYLRAVGMIRILLNGSAEKVKEPDWPWQLDC